MSHIPSVGPGHSGSADELEDARQVLRRTGHRIDRLHKVGSGYLFAHGDCQCALRISTEQLAELREGLRDVQGRAYVFPDKYYVASTAAVSDIKVWIDTAIPDAWQLLIYRALSHWNADSLQSSISLRFVSQQSDADTLVRSYDIEDGLLGWADMPAFSAVGRSVNINRHYGSLYSDSIYTNTIVHEMGHALGFAHAGGEDPSFGLPDRHLAHTSPFKDPRAVMASAGHEWYGFSADEKDAMRLLHPRSAAPPPNV